MANFFRNDMLQPNIQYSVREYARGDAAMMPMNLPTAAQYFENHAHRTNTRMYNSNTRYLAKKPSPRGLAPIGVPLGGKAGASSNRLYPGPPQKGGVGGIGILATGPGQRRFIEQERVLAAEEEKRRAMPWLRNRVAP